MELKAFRRVSLRAGRGEGDRIRPGTGRARDARREPQASRRAGRIQGDDRRILRRHPPQRNAFRPSPLIHSDLCRVGAFHLGRHRSRGVLHRGRSNARVSLDVLGLEHVDVGFGDVEIGIDIAERRRRELGDKGILGVGPAVELPKEVIAGELELGVPGIRRPGDRMIGFFPEEISVDRPLKRNPGGRGEKDLRDERCGDGRRPDGEARRADGEGGRQGRRRRGETDQGMGLDRRRGCPDERISLVEGSIGKEPEDPDVVPPAPQL